MHAVVWLLALLLAGLPAPAQVQAQAQAQAQAGASGEAPRARELGERVLATGSWGADVFELQRHLRRLGYEIAADGMYGPMTRAAVADLQERSGLTPSGRFDAAAYDALNRALLRTVGTMDYTVKPGDSLWSIARAFATQMEMIVALNDLPDRPLRIGETIKVPAMPEYTVRPGDSLWVIARRHQVTVAEIAALNGLDPQGILRPGTVLRLPRGAFTLSVE